MRTVLSTILLAVVLQHAAAQETWRRTYGGFGSDLAHSIEQTPDGGYIVAGSSGSVGTGGDCYVIKLDALGELEWSNYFGGELIDELWDIEVLDAGYIAVGTTGSPSNGGYDGLLIRLDDTGNVMWQRNFGSADWDFLYGLDVTENGFFLTGATYMDPSVGSSCWLIHTDFDGVESWSTTIGGAEEDEARAVRATLDGGCVIAGTYGRSDGTSDAYVAKYDALGTLDWDLAFGTDSIEQVFGLDLTEAGDIIVGGQTQGYSTYQRLLLAKVHQSGVVEWTRDIGQISDWFGREVRVRPDGGIAMAAATVAFGFGAQDMYLLLTDQDGGFEFGTTYGGSGDDMGYALDLTSDGGYVLAGPTESYGPGLQAMFVVKTGPDGLTASQAVNEYFDPVPVPIIGASENRYSLGAVGQGGSVDLPFAAHLIESVSLFDMHGRVVVLAQAMEGSSVRITSLSPGAYILSVLDNRNRQWLFQLIVV